MSLRIDFYWFSVSQVPVLKPMELMVEASPRRIFANAHTYHINSISINSDQETYLSADDLRVNLWHMEVTDQVRLSWKGFLALQHCNSWPRDLSVCLIRILPWGKSDTLSRSMKTNVFIILLSLDGKPSDDGGISKSQISFVTVLWSMPIAKACIKEHYQGKAETLVSS